MKSGIRQYLPILFACFFIVLHLPFLSADPDAGISDGRGPFTDEGLYSGQIRNYIHSGNLTLEQSDNFIKTPLFGSLLFLPFKVFGIHLVTGRLMVLITIVLILLLIFNRPGYRLTGLLSLPVVFTGYYIFHYTHYCLSEMLSCAFALSGVFLLAASFETPSPKHAFLTSALVSCAYFLKIQFLYLALLTPFALSVMMITGMASRKALFRQLLLHLACLLLFFLIYVFCWYLPHRTFFDYVMSNQTSGRFAASGQVWDRTRNVIQYYFLNPHLLPYTAAFCTLLACGLMLMFRSGPTRFKMLYITLTCWLILELHKLPMTYLPSRYLVSLIFVMGMISTVVLGELLTREPAKQKVTRTFSVLVIITLGIFNLYEYGKSLAGRTFVTDEINRYVSSYRFDNRVAMGAWAPSLTWETSATSFPVWNGYFNDQDIFTKYHPALIIAEEDEGDSEKAFASKGISIAEHADSSRTFRLHEWTLVLYWIKQ